jgi:DNA-directed RNA polymerase subunit RPC12/RpoP
MIKINYICDDCGVEIEQVMFNFTLYITGKHLCEKCMKCNIEWKNYIGELMWEAIEEWNKN